jgi:hypothetical protein
MTVRARARGRGPRRATSVYGGFVAIVKVVKYAVFRMPALSVRIAPHLPKLLGEVGQRLFWRCAGSGG